MPNDNLLMMNKIAASKNDANRLRTGLSAAGRLKMAYLPM